MQVANYTDDSTPFSAKLDLKSVAEELKISSSWFRNNDMRANTDMSHLLLSGSNNLTANIDGNVIESEDNKILLGLTIDSSLSFNKYINNLRKKTQRKA